MWIVAVAVLVLGVLGVGTLIVGCILLESRGGRDPDLERGALSNPAERD
jgi:hypothetical protein